MRQRAETAYLVCKALNKPLPQQFAEMPPGKAIQIPQCGGYHNQPDPDAACQPRMTSVHRGGLHEFPNIGIR